MAAKIQFFPMDIQYKEIDGKPVIHLYGTTAEGQQVCVIDEHFDPYFYVVPKSEAQMKLDKLEVEEEGVKYFVKQTSVVQKKLLGQTVRAIKTIVNVPRAVPAIRELLATNQEVLGMYEYDIQFVRRYLIDKQITPLTLVQAEVEPAMIRAKVPVFNALSINQFSDDTITKPKILAFDIETYNPQGKNIDSEKNPIIMLSFCGANFQKVYTWKQYSTKLQFVEFVNSEAGLIEKFKEVLDSFKPDILVGYYSEGFDMPYLEVRAKKYKIKLDINLDHSELQVRRRKTISSPLVGIVHLDLLNFVRKVVGRGMEIDRYTLDAVAEELLGEGKPEVNLDLLAAAWDSNTRQLDEFCNYNMHDALLTYRLCEKLLPNIFEMVKIVGLPIFDVSKMAFSQLVEWYVLRQSQQFGELAPNKPDHNQVRERRAHTYQGAFVFEPKPGLYKDVVLFDFRSLYPSIISTHNISPETLNCGCCEGTNTVPDDPTHWFCTKRKGFIPTLIEDLITRRMRIKEMMKDKSDHILLKAREQTLKLLANSFYGYLGFYAARWYNLQCAQAVTSFGRYYIQMVITKARAEGFEVLYSDTDSVFLLLGKRTVQDANRFAESLNSGLPGVMELEYEGFYPAGLFVSLKTGPSGAKKKYALLSENGSVRIKGFETVRRNWSLIAKEVQREVIETVLKTGEPHNALIYVKKVIEELKTNKVPLDKVVIHTQLQKYIEEYDSVGPHVRAAMRLKNQGNAVGPGSIIRFVVVKGTGKLGDRVRLEEEATQQEYDASYYIQNQIIPSVERIFAVLGIDSKELLESKEQQNLKGFF
ncbi:MAG: DNA-directed DNA polymerase [Candidatus Woesearchaeota archaeon]